MIRDDWQDKGSGTLLINYLIDIAKKKGNRRACRRVSREKFNECKSESNR